MKRNDGRTGEVRELVELLPLMAPSAVVFIASWSVAEPWVPILGDGVGMSMPNAVSVHSFMRAPSLTEQDFASFRTLRARYAVLSEAATARLRIPLRRLNRSLLPQSDPIDKAIDLGIALEAVFLDDGQEDIGATLRMRAARYLDDIADARKTTDRLIAALYKDRSKAVHRGKLKSAPGVAAANLDAGQRKVRDAIVKIIRAGSWPNWDAVLYGS